MKILHLVPKYAPSIGGVETFLYDLVEEQRKKHRVEVLTTDLFSFKPFRRMIIKHDFDYVKRFKAVNMFPLLPYGLGSFSLGMLKEVLSIEDFDIIHSHSYGYFTTWLGSLKKILKGSKHVIHTHSDPGKRYFSKRFFDSLVSKFSLVADKIITISDAEFQHLLRLGIKREKLAKVPLGLNIRRYKKVESKSHLRDFILFVGRFEIFHKGIDILFKALKIALEKNKGLKLVMIGEGDYNRIKELAKSLSIINNVIFVGRLPSSREGFEQLLEYYSSCRFLVLPSRFEPFGLVIIEAISMGKPVVATRVGGVLDILNEKYGFLVEPENAGALAKAMIRMYEMSYEELSKLSINALEASKLYDIRKVSEEIEEIYKEVLKN